MRKELRHKVYKILKRHGITSQLDHASTFKNENDYGYTFKLKDGRQGNISLVNGSKVIF